MQIYCEQITNEINPSIEAERCFARLNLLAYLCFLERSQFKHIFLEKTIFLMKSFAFISFRFFFLSFNLLAINFPEQTWR